MVKWILDLFELVFGFCLYFILIDFGFECKFLFSSLTHFFKVKISKNVLIFLRISSHLLCNISLLKNIAQFQFTNKISIFQMRKNHNLFN
jgi:hypothetical protein